MENLSQEDKNLLKNLLKTKLLANKSLKEEEPIYRETLKSVESEKLKEAIREIGKEEYWDQGIHR